jgi:hypothetical protein
MRLPAALYRRAFTPVPERLVTCKHGDSKSLCLLCRTVRDVTLCVHDRVAEACRYCSREDHADHPDMKKPQVDPLEFSLWLQAQDVEALTAWITQCDGAPADRESAG